MNWNQLDWQALDRLRSIFLAEEKPQGDYWRSLAELENYDFTFGHRIAWKWDAALNELRRVNWVPTADSVLDWGCGSGVAGRRVTEFFGLKSLRVFDRSPLAMQYAMDTGHAEGWRTDGQTVGLLVLSHVLNELNDRDRGDLLRLADRAEAILWVEPGTYADSRALIEVRETLRERFRVVAPCTHQERCGMLVPENERHWCHFFARPPVNIMADSNWVRFSQRAGIDLRSLPYSYLVMERIGCRASAPLAEVPKMAPKAFGALQEQARIIGAPRAYKGFAKVLACQADGVREVTMQKRDDPELFRALKNGEATMIPAVRGWPQMDTNETRIRDHSCGFVA